MKAFRIPLISVLLFFIGLSGVSSGKGAPTQKTPDSKKMPDFAMVKEEGPIEIEADRLSYDKEEQLYQAHGNVDRDAGEFLSQGGTCTIERGDP